LVQKSNILFLAGLVSLFFEEKIWRLKISTTSGTPQMKDLRVKTFSVMVGDSPIPLKK